ncbi:cytochrome c1 [Notoacmeibacter ruber]|uniref:cytochrome c1 n=1 Tax=Notoacmeibacter ruber TaxID=2670375 RepID=UPI001FE11FE3|nr:cytochrome c1 [Notoacmeibacter ruber]
MPEDGAASAADEEGEQDATAEGEEEHEGEGEASHTQHYPIKKPMHVDWSFAGPFGHYDIGQLQRGLKIYKEVCSACHSMKRVAFRDLEELGYSEAQVKTFAADYEVEDGPNADGDMFTRPATGSDRFPSPFPNEEAAAAANNGAAPPDFSLLAKARAVERGFPHFIFDIFTGYAENGPDYIYSLLHGYDEETPEHIELPDGVNYNPYFISAAGLAMAKPIFEGMVDYDDGSPQTLDQYSKDIAAFMMWAAEPKLEQRKKIGLRVMLFLVLFGALLWLTKRKVWHSVKH